MTPVTRQQQLEDDFSIASALHKTLNAPDVHAEDPVASIRTWSSQDVIDWMYSLGIDATVVECFERHDVDGAVISDIQFEELKELDIQSFGKRHQVWNAICMLRGDDCRPSPQPTPFEDISRPCTATTRRSSSRKLSRSATPVAGEDEVASSAPGKKRRGRKAPKHVDVIMPQESVSIVAIEQLLPKPHKCAKGERCAKRRKQQRELQQLQDENAIGCFPISPGKGGRVVVRGDPGNATTADNIVPNVRMQSPMEPQRPNSDAIPSLVASSDLLGPGQLPEFALQAQMLDRVESRDPQDNVRQFLNFQHIQTPSPPVDDAPATPPLDYYQYATDPIQRSGSVPVMFPERHHQPYPSFQAPTHAPGRQQQLSQLPRLDIPNRSATAGPSFTNARESPKTAVPESAASICRSATASPVEYTYRLGTPASEMDVALPVTAIPTGPISCDTSASVPPNMHYRHQQPLGRSASRAEYWRRPSIGLPIVKEGEEYSTAVAAKSDRLAPKGCSSTDDSTKSAPAAAATSGPEKKSVARDPFHDSPTTQHFGYGSDCTQAGWMKKRKTKLLRHEWQAAHFRLQGTELGMYPNARLSAALLDSLNVEDYAVACSSAPSNSKLAAAMKVFRLRDEAKKGGDETAFAFQLVPAGKEEGRKHASAHHHGAGKTHHFAVKNKDERIDWMRELMLAKARQQKREGFDVEVNGVQA